MQGMSECLTMKMGGWRQRAASCWFYFQTRTTKAPAFWGYPRRLMISLTIELYWIPSQKKTKPKLQIQSIFQNVIFF